MKLLLTLIIALTTISCTAENPKATSLAQPLITQEKATKNHAQIALSMYCFWTGELKLGAIEGVILTEAGWLDGHEVTLVTYDKTAIKTKDLITKATAIDCAKKVYLPAALKNYRKAKSSDQKKQLQGTPFAKLNLTPAQATKINAYARTNPAKAKAYLTPEQLKSL